MTNLNNEYQKTPDPDREGKKDTPCLCGDENHKNLQKWYERYKNDPSLESIKKTLFNDKLNKAVVKKEIQNLLLLIPVINNYCPSCVKLLNEWPEPIDKVPAADHGDYKQRFYEQPHYKDTLQFEAGYRNGCRLCILLVQCGYGDQSFELWHKLNNRLDCLGKPKVISLSISAPYEGFKECMLGLAWPGMDICPWFGEDLLFCAKNQNKKLFSLRQEPSPLTTNKIPSQLDLAKKWLDACSEFHDSCQLPQDHQLPTRLIYVGSTTSRLVLTSTFTAELYPRYATLSHCWGTHRAVKLKKNSLENFMIMIPETALTKTFHDAIHITRSLGLRYLWIDTLCIIQDLPQDWAKESLLMSFIYSCSTINISATGAEDGRRGCFLKPPGFVGNIHIELKEKKEIWDIAPRGFYDSVIRSPLVARAWCLQERLLSPRTLHFTKTELYWECRNCGASESFPGGLPDHEDVLPRKSLSEIWDAILIQYTAAKLSFGKDILVAISGIAKQVQKENKDQYLAGLWRKDIELQLLWSVIGIKEQNGRAYHAPSWSWASGTDYRVSPFHARLLEGSRYTYYAHVIDAHVVPKGHDPFGEIVGGVLRMGCSGMLVGKYMENKNSITIESPDGKDKQFPISVDRNEYGGQNIYILPIVEVLLQDMHGGKQIHGLLLVPTGKKGEYIRIGTLKFFSGWDNYEQRREDLFTLLKQIGKGVGEANCAEILLKPEYANECYVINII